MTSYMFFLIISAWIITLPNVAAIRCYDCLPGPPGNICTMFVNVTDCDEAPGAPPGKKYDACGKASYEIAFGNNTLTMNALTCAVKSMCQMMKKKACNATMWKQMGVTLTRCDVNCCFEDKCNCVDPPCPLPFLPWLRRLAPKPGVRQDREELGLKRP